MVGAGEWLLQTTTVRQDRVRFDRPLGFFQAVKHPLVNVMIQIDNAKSLTYNAACAIDHEPEKALQYARMAKSEASDMAVFLEPCCSIPWRHRIYLGVLRAHVLQRQMHNQVYLGDAKLPNRRTWQTWS